MIFNIAELTEKIKKTSRPKPKKEKEDKAKSTPPSKLAISQQTSGDQKTQIFEIAKSGRKKRKSLAKILVDKYNLNKSSSKVLLALLYWSSGAKYPSSNFIAFSNSDANLVKMFLGLLRETFPIDEKKIKIHLQLYKTQDDKEMKKFWSQLLQVPSDQFYKPTITKSQPKKIRPNYFGTCTVRYYNLELLLTIMDIYEQLSSYFNKD